MMVELMVLRLFSGLVVMLICWRWCIMLVSGGA